MESNSDVAQKLSILKSSKLLTVVLGLSGSVATIKATDLIDSLVSLSLNVVVV